MSVNPPEGTLTIENSHLDVKGNVSAVALKLGPLRLTPSYGLDAVANVSNSTTHTLELSNATTGLVTTANVVVGGGLEVGGDLGSTLLNTLYPVGMVLAMVQNWGGFAGQTWVQFAQGRTLVGQDSSDTAFDAVTPTAYIGEKSHTLTVAELPSHTHTFVDDYRQLQTNGAIYHNDFSKRNTAVNAGSALDTTSATGGDVAHNNVQPYEVVYYYKRTA